MIEVGVNLKLELDLIRRCFDVNIGENSGRLCVEKINLFRVVIYCFMLLVDQEGVFYKVDLKFFFMFRNFDKEF